VLCDLITYRAASLERPSVSIADPAAWRQLFGGSESESGISVTDQSLLEFSPIWAGIAMISSDVAQVPTYVLRRTPDGGKDRDKTHGAYDLLRWCASPSQHLCASLWKELMIGRAILHGNSYAEIKRDGAESPKDLPLLPPHPETHLEQINGALWYVTGPQRRKIRPRNVFHLRGPSTEATGGKSLVQFARNSVGRGIATDRFASRFFRNGATPSGILTHPGTIGETALNNLRQSIQELHGGVSNAHRLGVFEEGVTWHALGIDPEKSQMIASLNWSVKECARWLQIPPHKLGDDSRTSYNSVEQEELSYKFSTLGNWFCKLRDEARQKLLSEREKKDDSHTIEEQQNQFLAADTKSRHEVYAIGLTNGIYNIDEVRSIEGFNPLPDDLGKQHLRPLNLAEIGEEPKEEQQQPAPAPEVDEDQDGDPSRAAHVQLLEHALQRALNRLCHASRKFDGQPVGDLSSHAAPIGDMLQPVLLACRAVGLTVPESSGDVAASVVRTWQGALEESNGHKSEDEAEKRSDSVAGTITVTRCLTDLGVIK
jgi:HK97 family phage portal protein